MSDHIARVREQAERASREAYDFNGVRGHDSRNGTRRKAFIAGAVWLASRLTRENIAEALMQACHDPYFEGLVFAELREREARRFYEQADAVLELIGGDDEGDNGH